MLSDFTGKIKINLLDFQQLFLNSHFFDSSGAFSP